MFVANRMTANPVCVTSETSLVEAMEIMRTRKFRRLPVVNAGKLVGIVTDRDVRRASASPATTLDIFELKYLLDKVHVKDIMSKEVVTIRDDASIEEAALSLYTHRIGGLVVLDKVGAVVGIITETDLFKTFVDIMGLPDGKTRITIDVSDRVGVIHEVAEVFADMGINISSMVTYTMPNGQCELILRADVVDTAEISAKLAAKGYPVTHVAQIGASN